METGLKEKPGTGMWLSHTDAVRYPVEVTLWATVVVGLATALAPVIPLAIRSTVLVAALIGWLIGVAYMGASAIPSIWLSKRSGDSRSAILIGAAGILMASVALVQLFLIRTWMGKHALTWNIDYRWALNHAQAIARTGGVDASLDFAGKAVDYHVGSAWLAGAVGRVLGAGISEVLFGVIPFLCVLSAALAIFCLLRETGLSGPYALLAAGAVLSLPAVDVLSFVPTWPGGLRHPGVWLANFLSMFNSLMEELQNPETWFFSSHLMLNSLMAISVGLSSCALLLRRKSGLFSLFVGAAGLAAVMEIKPQFFVSFGLFVGLLGLWRMRDTDTPFPRRATLLFAAFFALTLAVGMRNVLPGKENVFARP